MMNDLIEKIKLAEYPSRDLDADIFIATTPELAEAGHVDRLGGVVGWWPRNSPYQSAREVPKYTSSMDDALRLCEPLISWKVWSTMEGGYAADAFRYLKDMSERPTGLHRYAPMALCIAALKATVVTSQHPRALEE